jgi:hypothetical protein
LPEHLAVAPTPQQRKANLRLALILASAAAIFALGFVARIVYFGG